MLQRYHKPLSLFGLANLVREIAVGAHTLTCVGMVWNRSVAVLVVGTGPQTAVSVGRFLRYRRGMRTTSSIAPWASAKRSIGLALLASSGWACGPAVDLGTAPTHAALAAAIDSIAGASGAEVAVFFDDLSDREPFGLEADLRMHAASTMKIPVMFQLYRDHQAGLLQLDDSIEVTRTFHSIVDGSAFELDDSSDSETALYDRVGLPISYRELNELMITVSSNLATNILIAALDAERVTETARSLGADSIEVLRGVEDIPAFEAGLSNTTTARDLGALLRALALGQVAGPASTTDMIQVLRRQQFDEKIPAGLPTGTPVAHKTGNITGISHDAAIVRPGAPNAYVLVVLTRGFPDSDRAAKAIADVAALVDDHVLSRTPH